LRPRQGRSLQGLAGPPAGGLIVRFVSRETGSHEITEHQTLDIRPDLACRLDKPGQAAR
jgi:hypothetical protein